MFSLILDEILLLVFHWLYTNCHGLQTAHQFSFPSTLNSHELFEIFRKIVNILSKCTTWNKDGMKLCEIKSSNQPSASSLLDFSLATSDNRFGIIFDLVNCKIIFSVAFTFFILECCVDCRFVDWQNETMFKQRI